MGIGDELMVTGMAREAQRHDPRRVRVEYEKRHLPRWSPLWDGNPRIARPGERGDFQILRPRNNYLRPYCSAKTERQWTWRRYSPPVGEIYFAQHEMNFAAATAPGAIVLGATIKRGASPNKQWGEGRWAKLAMMLAGRGDLVQIGDEEPYALPGVRFIRTTIRQAAAIVNCAKLVVCGEGALHHIAAATHTDALVIFGGYVSPEVTGYQQQVNLFTGDGLGCGMRVPCDHCLEAMAAIRPEDVADRVMGMLG